MMIDIFFSYNSRAFKSGFEETPVMCQTFHTFYDKNYCPWVSCGEWCLTKTSGFCPQMYATSRRNGTDLLLENCTRITTTNCPEVKNGLFLHILLFTNCALQAKCFHLFRAGILIFFFSFSIFFSRLKTRYINRNIIATMELNALRLRGFSIVRWVNRFFHLTFYECGEN